MCLPLIQKHQQEAFSTSFNKLYCVAKISSNQNHKLSYIFSLNFLDKLHARYYLYQVNLMCPWPKIRTNCNSKWKNYCARYHRPQLSKIFGQFNTHQCDNVPCGHSGCFLQFQNTHFWNYICWQLCRHL